MTYNEGLFAKAFIPPDSLVSVYAGKRLLWKGCDAPACWLAEAEVLGSVNSQVRPTVGYMKYTCSTCTFVVEFPCNVRHKEDGWQCWLHVYFAQRKSEIMYMWPVWWEKYNWGCTAILDLIMKTGLRIKVYPGPEERGGRWPQDGFTWGRGFLRNEFTLSWTALVQNNKNFGCSTVFIRTRSNKDPNQLTQLAREIAFYNTLSEGPSAQLTQEINN
jgi:hypothetical protein